MSGVPSEPRSKSSLRRSPSGVPSEPRSKAVAGLAGLAVILAGAVLLSLTVGRYPISLSELLGILTGSAGDGVQADVLLHLRLPRIVVAGLVGAALAGAGCAYQGLFRNPMVSPDILGASAGAGFGAALGILFSLGDAGVEVFAFAAGVTAVAVTYVLSVVLGRRLNAILILVLSGLVVGNLFTAFTSAVKFVADPNAQLPEITFWLMGGLANVREGDVWWLLGAFVVGAAGLVALRWRLNVMTFGDEEALSLGVDVRRVRYATIAFATLMTSSAVAVAGMVGWVGLIIPHLARLIVGSDHRVLLPASMLAGASFLLVVDDLCRSLYTTEIPLSIVTSVIGAPLFIILLARQGRR